MTLEKKKIGLRPYSIKELALLYEVDRRTFRKWLRRYEDAIGKQQGHYYNITQVKMIFEKFSLPGNIILEP